MNTPELQTSVEGHSLDGDGDLCAIGKHLLAEKMYMAECRLEIKS